MTCATLKKASGVVFVLREALSKVKTAYEKGEKIYFLNKILGENIEEPF